MSYNPINNCPVCTHHNLVLHLDVEDHFLSKESFQILQCAQCLLGITQPQPGKDEIGEYYNSKTYISHQSQKKGLFGKLYQMAQKVNFRTKLHCLDLASNTERVLDYGAGSGGFVHYLNSRNIQAIGVEPNASARENAAQSGIDILDMKAITNLSAQSFDRITLWHVLEHIHDLKQTLFDLDRLLSENGRIIVAVPNYMSKDAQIYQSHWAGYDVPRHLWHFSQESLKILFSQHGLHLSDIRPMKLDSYYVSLLSEKYRDGNFVRGIVNGLISNLNHKNHRGYSSNIFIFTRSI